MTNISFWTPIQYLNPNKHRTEALIETVDDYFYLSGRKATVLERVDGQTAVVMMEGREQSCLETCLKIASYFTIVIPVLMLLAKMLLRVLVEDEYQINQALTEQMPTDQKIIAFYAQKNVFGHFNRPLEVDLNRLNLPLDRVIEINPNHYLEGIRPLLPQNKTMRDAVTEVIEQINAKIGNDPTEKLEKNRTVELSTQAPWIEGGSNLYFYNRDKLIPWMDSGQNALEKVLNKFVENGYIFSWKHEPNHLVIKV